MTREEAIKLIEHIGIAFVPTDQYGDYDDPQPYEEAIDMAIEALSAENSNAKTQNSNQETQKSNGDLIKRADAKQQVSEWATIITKPTLLDKDATMVVLDSLPSAEAVSRESYIKAVGYVEWLEKIIVMLEPEYLCEDTTDREWCEENCHYSSIQAECLRHLYEVSKGGGDE